MSEATAEMDGSSSSSMASAMRRNARDVDRGSMPRGRHRRATRRLAFDQSSSAGRMLAQEIEQIQTDPKSFIGEIFARTFTNATTRDANLWVRSFVPTYEYKCTRQECGHEWEIDQPITEDPIKDCPECGKETARRLVSGGAGFCLKGPGWYRDGY